ncbi:MAG: hypothetical protein ACYS47_09265, partial [Planctomycetota bacterium]
MNRLSALVLPAVLVLFPLLGLPVPAVGADREEEVFLHTSQEIADLLAMLSHPEPKTTPEAQCLLLDRITEKIEETGSCFFRSFDGKPREVRRELLARFLDLSPEVQKAYRERVDPGARELWERSRGRNPADLEGILARFPLSSLAPAAARALARFAIERGEYQQALRRLHEAAPPGVALAAKDALLAAFCHRRTGWIE